MTHEPLLLDMLSTHGGALRRIARVYAGASGEEDDLYQEILMQLWRSLPAYRGDAAPGTWLYRVALNTALTWRRRSERQSARDAVALGPARTAVPAAPHSEGAILEDFLTSLAPPDRTILLLYMEGLSYQEIGDVTGLTTGAVGVRIHRLKKRFAQRYEVTR